MHWNEDLRAQDTPRTAEVSSTDERLLGVCIFLTAAELRELGVDPEQTDAIEYRIVKTDSQSTVEVTEASETSVPDAPDSITD